MRRRSQRIMNKSPQPDEAEEKEAKEKTTPEVKPPLKRKKNKVSPITENYDSSSCESDISDFVQPVNKIKRKPSTPLVVKTPKKKKKKTRSNTEDNSSSSESDIGDYLQPVDKINLNSSFFDLKKTAQTSNSGVKDSGPSNHCTRLSESSESDDEPEQKRDDVTVTQLTINNDPKEEEPSCSQLDASDKVAKLNFQQLQEYTSKIEEAKKQVEAYQARKSQPLVVKSDIKADDIDISDLLAIGEKTMPGPSGLNTSISLHSSDYESLSDSEKEDWEEIKIKDQDTKAKSDNLNLKDVQITVELPGGSIRKKKQVDLMAAIKRRLNRMRKENQVYIHKVHVLCWIAHGNFVNSVLNNVKILSSALSLVPSQKSYPPNRADLSYLEQLLQWYKKAIALKEKPLPKSKGLLDLLIEQIEKKHAYNKRMLVYIFIALLRSLGLQCRLVLSFQLEPLRPPASDLHSFKANADEKAGTKSKKTEKQSCKNENDNTESKQVEKKSQSRRSEEKTATKFKKTEKETSSSKLKSSESIKKHSGDIKDVTEKSRNEKSSERKGVDLKKLKEASKNISPDKIEESKDDKKTSKTSKESKHEKKTKNSESNHKSETKAKSEKIESEKGSRRSTRSKNEHNDKSSIKNNAKILEKEKKKSGTKKEESKSSRKESSTKKNIAQVDGLNDSESEMSYFPSRDFDISIPCGFQGSNYNSASYHSQNRTLISISAPFWQNLIYKSFTIPQLDGGDDIPLKSTKSKPKVELSKLKKLAKEAGISKQHGNKSNSKNVKPTSKKSVSVASPGKLDASKSKQIEKKSELIPAIPVSSNILDIRSDIIDIMKNRISEQKAVDKKRLARKAKSTKTIASDEDSDYVPEPVKKKVHDSEDDFVPKTKVKRRIPVKKADSSRKVLSSDDENEKDKKKKGVDVWAEVFLEAEEKWISVDVVRGEVHCVQQLFTRATHPVSYIVAWNNDNSLKDITMRYCNNFNTVTRKLRVEKKWWDESLKPFIGKKTARDREEDDELARFQLEKPLPTSISEYKNHPLYVLKRHLLKFEGIYPSDAPTLGFVRGEPVYARDCVYTLHSRDIWLKSAKVVKPGEKPYKIVKARPKYDKLSNTVITDQMLEIFGPWQTEDYVPPTAENGIVPRNAYGNVELFKSCMLPKKTVHLKLPGLNKVARKLNIDCASAIVGFDFHSGWSHPTYDGFVVCEEYADTLVAAWELEQEEIERKETEKIEKRVYDNWKRLIKGLLIRERLQAKYEFGDSSGKKERKRKQDPVKRPAKKKARKISSDDTDSDFV